jgi:DNA polymerase epsilon subunit 1
LFFFRLITEFEESNSIVINNAGCYQSVCVELEIDGLAVNTLLQAHHVNDIEGTSSTVAFDTMPQASLEEMMGNAPGPSLANYDETALCSGAFRVLRSMVTSWLRDVSVHRNLMADYQLVHFYRFETTKRYTCAVAL